MMIEDMNKRPNKQNWAKSVKYLLESLGFNDVWYFQGVGDVNYFLSIFKQRLSDNFLQEWNTRIEASSRANTYSLFSNFSYKPYLDILKLNKFRTAMSRLRMSSHRLEIEAGRWHKPQRIPLPDRKCIYCNKLEDEFHFIFECVLYNDLRTKFIKKYFWHRPNIPKFVELLTSTNRKTIQNLATFIFESFKIRYGT